MNPLRHRAILAGSVLFLVLLLRPTMSAAQMPAVDYIFPTPAELAVSRVSALDPVAIASDGEAVSYLAFNGQQHALRRFEGKNVSLLLPDSWLSPTGLSDHERRIAIDRADHLYEWNTALLGRAPRGDGKLVIAVVPTCGAGCGYVAAKGIELAPDAYNISAFKEAGDAAPPVLIHEMNHNFDLFASYHSYAPDAAHAWTLMMDAAVPSYLGTGAYEPTERLRKYLGEYVNLDHYMAAPTANWTTCRAGDLASCPFALNSLWGVIGLKAFLLHGITSLPVFLDYFRNWSASNPVPATPEAKEDLHIAALSAAANADLGCYVDAWKWWASPTLRATMALRGTNARCLDADHDGWRPFDGDPDDSDPTRHPGATEVLNNVDDDGNGAIDDLPIVESPGSDLPALVPVGTAARIDAALTAGDSDSFLLTVFAPSRVRFSLQSMGTFKGWLFLYNQDGSWRKYIHADVGREQLMSVDLPAGTWRFSVALNVNSAPGQYRARVYAVQPWPASWGRTALAAGASAGSYRLTAVTENASAFSASPTEVRFWVSGYGFVGSQPWGESVALDWTLPSPIDSRPLFVRAQPVRAGAPIADLTAPIELATVAAPIDFAADVSGNTVTFSWTPGIGQLAPTGYAIVGGTATGGSSVVMPVAAGTSVTVQWPTGAYFVRLHALSGALHSAASNEIRIYVNVPGLPAAPANLLGTVNGNAVALAWRLGVSTLPATSLQLDVSGGLNAVLTLPLAESIEFSGVPSGTYTVRLRAVNGVGSSSASNAVTLTFPSPCPGPPQMPANFVAQRSGAVAGAIWDLPPSGPAPTSYTLHVAGTYSLDIPTTARALAGVVPPGTYVLSVSATNACGRGAATPPQTVVVP